MPFPAKDFPSSKELKRVAQEHEFYQFYSSETLDPLGTSDRAKFRLRQFFESDEKKALILDVALNLAPIVVDAGTDFTFGKLPKVELDDDATNREAVQKRIDEIINRNKLLQKFSDSTALFQVAGHTHFKLYSQGNQAFVDEVPYCYWFPNYDGVPVGIQRLSS